MASDTGAPWNLPYPEDTDLVRDGAADIEALALAVAAGLTAANAGIGSNVVQVTEIDSFATTSTTYVDVPGITATITPSSATAKVLVMLTGVLGVSGTVSNTANVQVLRDATPIGNAAIGRFAYHVGV
jgi:hypothetical protein